MTVAVNCGVACLSDVAHTITISVIARVATIGPFAAFRPAADSAID